MAVKPIMGSYPYLTLAKKYDIAYEDVLMLAEAIKEHRHLDNISYGDIAHGVNLGMLVSQVCNSFNNSWEMAEFCEALHNASNNFRDIIEQGWDQS